MMRGFASNAESGMMRKSVSRTVRSHSWNVIGTVTPLFDNTLMLLKSGDSNSMAGQGCGLSFAITAMLLAIQLPPRAWLSMLAVAGKSSRETSCSSLYGLDEAVCVAASFDLF
jgi:hypothetical protein